MKCDDKKETLITSFPFLITSSPQKKRRNFVTFSDSVMKLLWKVSALNEKKTLLNKAEALSPNCIMFCSLAYRNLHLFSFTLLRFLSSTEWMENLVQSGWEHFDVGAHWNIARKANKAVSFDIVIPLASPKMFPIQWALIYQRKRNKKETRKHFSCYERWTKFCDLFCWRDKWKKFMFLCRRKFHGLRTSFVDKMMLLKGMFCATKTSEQIVRPMAREKSFPM